MEEVLHERLAQLAFRAATLLAGRHLRIMPVTNAPRSRRQLAGFLADIIRASAHLIEYSHAFIFVHFVQDALGKTMD